MVINVTKECEHKKEKQPTGWWLIRFAYVLCPYNEARRDDELNAWKTYHKRNHKPMDLYVIITKRNTESIW